MPPQGTPSRTRPRGRAAAQCWPCWWAEGAWRARLRQQGRPPAAAAAGAQHCWLSPHCCPRPHPLLSQGAARRRPCGRTPRGWGAGRSRVCASQGCASAPQTCPQRARHPCAHASVGDSQAGWAGRMHKNSGCKLGGRTQGGCTNWTLMHTHTHTHMHTHTHTHAHVCTDMVRRARKTRRVEASAHA